MCEKRIKKIKKDYVPMRLQEARRLRRMRRPSTPPSTPSPDEIRTTPCPCPPKLMDKGTQTKVMLHLALRTVVLLQRNTLIQQKIVALQKETSDYVAAVMSVPENRSKYLEQVRLYGTEVAQANVLRLKPGHRVQSVKIEPGEDQQ